MDVNFAKFLAAALDSKSFKALVKVCDAESALDGFVGPRAIKSWVTAILKSNDFDGPLPGFVMSHLKLQKTEEGLNGVVSLGDFSHSFVGKNPIYLISSIIVGLDSPIGTLDKSETIIDFNDVGNWLDTLIEYNLIKSRKPPKKNDFTININKSNLLNTCQLCKGLQIQNNRFIGCLCLNDLKKNINLKDLGSYYTLDFNGLDKSDVQSILEILIDESRTL